MSTDPRTFLTKLFNTAVAADHPYQVLADHLPENRSGRAIVIGTGKAAETMAEVVEKHWQGEIQGLVVAPYRYGAQCSRIGVMEASHPVLDGTGERVAHRVLELISGLDESDRVIFLLSGGSSALLSLPAEGTGLADRQAVNRTLLKSDAAISEVNCIREHPSTIGGGRSAKACWPANVYTYAISDVLGDEVAIVAFGPSVSGPAISAGALAILRRYAIDVPQNVLDRLANPRSGAVEPDDPRLAHGHFQLIATPQNALDAAAVKYRVTGFSTLILGDLKGEAREVAKVHASIAQQIRKHGQPLTAPYVILSGGETTVIVCGNGRDGRNTELLLSLTTKLKGGPNIWTLTGDTDSISGSKDNAGALVIPCSHAHGEKAGLKIRDELDDNSGYGCFQTLGDLLVTGPTRTNMNDFRTILVFKS